MSFETLKNNLYVWRRIRDFEEEKYYRGKQTIKIHDKVLAAADEEGTTPFNALELETHLTTYIHQNGTSALEDGAKLATFLNDILGLEYSSQFYFDLLKRFHIVSNSLEFAPHGAHKAEIRFEDKATFNMGTGDFSFEAWIKYDFDKVRTDWQTIASNLKTSLDVNQNVIYDGGFRVRVKERTLSFQMGDGLGGNPQFGLGEVEAPLTSATSLQWNHVAVKRVGNNPSGWKVYLNGDEVTLSSSSTTMLSGDISDDQYYQIGDFEGEIKEARLYKRALTGGEVYKSYHNGTGDEPYISNNLVFHARLNEGQGNVVYDEISDERGEFFLAERELGEDDDPIFKWRRSQDFGMSPDTFNVHASNVNDLLEVGSGGNLSMEQFLTIQKLKWAFYGLDFNGVLDVELPFSISNVFGGGNFAVEAWYQVDPAITPPITDMVVVSSLAVNTGTGVWSGFSLSIENDMPTVIVGDAFGHVKMQANHITPPGGWHHVAFNRITTDPNNFEIYVDGALAPKTIVSNTLTTADFSTLGLMTMRVGSRLGSGAPTNAYFEGLMASVRLHDDVLTPTDVAANFQTQFDGAPAITDNLVVDLRLDKGYDYVGHLRTLGVSELQAIIHDGGTPMGWVPQPQGYRLYTDNEMAYAQTTLTAKQVVNKTRYDDSLLRIDQYMTEFHAIPESQLFQFVDDNWVGDAVIQMYPIRIETKFHMPDAGNDELWVRIFPDDIEVNNHEVQLTLEEIKHGRFFWETAHAAGATNDDKEDAWKTLTAKYGEKRGNYVAFTTTPTNIDEPGFDITAAIWPDLEPKLEDNTRPPKSRILPDKFTVSLLNADNTVIYEQHTDVISDNLKIGLDPDEESLTELDGDIQINEMDWLLNFDKAIEVGMGLKMDLNSPGGANLPQAASYTFPKIVVSGLKISMDKMETQYLLEDTFRGHFFTGGISLMRNAASTKNTEERTSDFKSRDNSDSQPQPVDPNDYTSGVDWDSKLLADALGFRRTLFESVSNSEKTDVQDAKDMNDVMFPITIGYYLHNLFSPWLELGDVEKVRIFFSENVVARGPAAAFRLNKAPYGVLPVTEFGTMSFSAADTPDFALMNNMKNLMVDHLYPHWDGKKDDVMHAGKSGADSKEVFADIVGRHAISVDMKKRSGVGQDTAWNNAIFDGRPMDAQSWFNSQTLFAGQLDTDMGNLKSAFSQPGDPEISFMGFADAYEDVETPVVDEFKLSRTRGLQPLGSSGLNFMQWLGGATLTELINEDFAAFGASTPDSLLYQLLRRSLLEEYYHTAANILGPNYDTALKRQDHELVNIDPDIGQLPPGITAQDLLDLPESRWNIFDEEVVGPPPGTTFINMVDSGIFYGFDIEFERVEKTRGLILRLSGRSTEELNNLFVEHIDLCSSRLDAWMTALVTHRMGTIYQGKDRDKAHGVFFGGYGWVNNLTSAPRAGYTGEFADGFLPASGPGNVEVDDDNGGYIQAPSINHAVTAAILRSGYMSRAHNGTSDQKNRMSVNLSSKRIREAKTLIEGLNNGQSLGAMLGYYFERKVHELGGGANATIYSLRAAFPFKTKETTPAGKSEEASTLAVVDALAMIKAFRQAELDSQQAPNPPHPDTFRDTYIKPNLSGSEPALTDLANDVVDEIINTESIVDALGDLAIAEGMFQIAQSSAASAGSMTKAISEGGHLREADINNTPRKGIAVTNRVAVGFPRVAFPATNADQPSDPWESSAETERSKTEPSLNQWLKQFIVDPDQIASTVSYSDVDAAVTYLHKEGPTYHRVSGRTIIADESDFTERQTPVLGNYYVGNDTDALEFGTYVSGTMKAKAFVFDGTTWSDIPVFLKDGVDGNVKTLDGTNKKIVLKNGYGYKSITVYNDGAEVAFYHCEEGNGTICYDQSGRENHATISATVPSAFHATDIKQPTNFLNTLGYNRYMVYENYLTTYDTSALVAAGDDWTITIKGVADYDSGNTEYVLTSGTGYIKYATSGELLLSDGTTNMELVLPSGFVMTDYHELVISKTVDTGVTTVSATIDGNELTAITEDTSSSAIPTSLGCVVDQLGTTGLTQFYRYADIADDTNEKTYVLLNEELTQVQAYQSQSGAGRMYTVQMVLSQKSKVDAFNAPTNNIFQKEEVDSGSYLGNSADYLDVNAFVSGALEATAYVFDGTSWTEEPVFLTTAAGNVFDIDNTQNRIVLLNNYQYKGITIYDDQTVKAFYNAEEGDGSIAYDQSGLSNNATITAASLDNFHKTDALVPSNYINIRGYNTYRVYDNFRTPYTSLTSSGDDWTVEIKGAPGFDSASDEYVFIGATKSIRINNSNELIISEATKQVKFDLAAEFGAAFRRDHYHEFTIQKVTSGTTTISATVDGVALDSTTTDTTSAPLQSSFGCPVEEVGNNSLVQLFRYVKVTNDTSAQEFILVDEDLSLPTTGQSSTGSGSTFIQKVVLNPSSTADVFNLPVDYFGKIHANVVNSPCLEFHQNDVLEIDDEFGLIVGVNDIYVETILEMPTSGAGVSQLDILANTDSDGGMLLSLQNGLVQLKSTTDSGSIITSHNGTVDLFNEFGGSWCRLGILLNRASNAYVFVNGTCVEEFDISGSSDVGFAYVSSLFKNYSSSSSVKVACMRAVVAEANQYFKSNVETINWSNLQSMNVPLLHSEARDLYTGAPVKVNNASSTNMEGSFQDFYAALALYGFTNRYARFNNGTADWSGESINTSGGQLDWEMEMTALPGANADYTEFQFSGEANDNLKFVQNSTTLNYQFEYQYEDQGSTVHAHRFGDLLLEEVKNRTQRIRIEKSGLQLKVFLNGVELDPETSGVDDICAADAGIKATLGSNSSWSQLISRFVLRITTGGQENESILVDKGSFVVTPSSVSTTGVSENVKIPLSPKGGADIFGNQVVSHPYGAWLYADAGYKVDWALRLKDRDRADLDGKTPGDALGAKDTQYFFEDTLSDVVVNTVSQDYEVTLTDIGMQPIDYLFMGANMGENDSELTQRIKYALIAQESLDPDGKFTIDFSNSGSANLSMTDLSPLVSRLHKLVTAGTMLRTSDITPSGNDDFNDYDYSEFYNRVNGTGGLKSRLETIKSALETAKSDLDDYNSTSADFDAARTALFNASQLGITSAIPLALLVNTSETKTKLLDELDTSITMVGDRLTLVTTALAAATASPSSSEVDKSVKTLTDAISSVFGRSFRAFPHFNNGVIEQGAFSKQLSVNSTLMDDHTDAAETVETWLQGAARVRKELREFEMIQMLHEGLNLNFDAFELTPFQFPYDDDTKDRWMAVKVNDEENLKHGRLCIAYATPEGFDASQAQVGLLIDEWVELIPEKLQDAGIAFHHNQPNSKAPKVILSAVAPVSTLNWSFDTMKTILAKTLDRLKTRALDFEDLSDTPVGQLAPMLVFRK